MLPMALSDTAAISMVGIVVSGVVGPGVAAHWARTRQRDDHQHARAQKELDDLTSLLDAAAVTLAPGVTRLRQARSEAEPDIAMWATEVHATYERLLLRVPVGDPVATSYMTARDRLTAVAATFDASASEAEENEAIESFEEARLSYLNAARACLTRKGGAA
jgi:hypothetical protein